jgi:hypothetical protein
MSCSRFQGSFALQISHRAWHPSVSLKTQWGQVIHPLCTPSFPEHLVFAILAFVQNSVHFSWYCTVLAAFFYGLRTFSSSHTDTAFLLIFLTKPRIKNMASADKCQEISELKLEFFL